MPFPKPFPKKVDKRQEKRTHDQRVRDTKTQVRQRDRYRCRVCGRRTRVVHEHHFRSVGGPVSLENSFCCCDYPDGICHPLLQQHRITPFVLGSTSRDPRDFDASEPLGFEMSADVATLVFENRSRPSSIVIVEA